MRTSIPLRIIRHGGVIVLMAVLTSAGTPSAAHARQQPPLLERPARLSVDGVPLVAALEELTRASGVALAYSPSLLPDRRVSCACASLRVGQALGRLLDGAGFTFRAGEGQVILSPLRSPEADRDAGGARPPRPDSAAGPPTARDVGGAAASLEDVPVARLTIRGRVVSGGRAPVAGATITVRGGRASATSDIAGNFALTLSARVAGGADTLRVHRLGYQTVTAPIEQSDGVVRIDIALPLEAVPLDEIVVTGTAGSRARRSQPALVAGIRAADVLDRSPVSNMSDLLAARVPGISITSASGATGASSRINIRGAASLSLSNQPLVFIDGVRLESQQRGLVSVGGQTLSAFDDLNPGDIDRIEVVKGPAAATLYGADASAGVIQIITRRGSAGARRFAQSITAGYGFVRPNFTPYDNYARCTAALVAPSSTNPLCRGLEPGAIVTDNPLAREGAYRDGWNGSLQYTGSGGGEGYGFYISGAVEHEDGTTRGNTLDRRSGRASFDWAASPKLSIEGGVGMGRTANELPQGDQSAFGYLIGGGLGSPLTVTSRPAGGMSGGWLLGNESVEAIASVLSRVTTLRSTPTARLLYTPLPWLTGEVTIGADINQSTAFEFYPKNDLDWYSGDQANGWVRSTRDNVTTWTVDYTANAHATFGGNERFASDFSLGSQYVARTEDVLRGTGVGLSTNSANLVSGAATSSAVEGFTDQRSLGFFAQEQLGIDDRLFVQVGARVDRNSAFGSSVGSFFLPKVGASWVVADDDDAGAGRGGLSALRLRAAYGTTGRAPTPGASLETWAALPYVSDAGALRPGIIPLNPGNADLRPEHGREIEAGIDAGFLGGHIGLELTYFDKRTSDLLVRVPQPPSSGFVQGAASSPYRNIGAVLNRGLETALRASILDRGTVSWDAMLGATLLRNELLSLGDIQPFQSSYRAFTPGRQLGAWYVNRIRSVDTLAHRVIVSDTAEYLGNQFPHLEASLNTTLTLFGAVRLYALFQAKAGYRVYDLGREYRDRYYRNSASVVLSPDDGGYSLADRLRRFGPYYAEMSGAQVALTEVKEDYIQRADFIRFRELSATVALPRSLAHRIAANSASLTVAGSNIALWSRFGGFDPEVLGTGPGSPNSTYYDQFNTADVFTTPPALRWTARLDVRF